MQATSHALTSKNKRLRQTTSAMLQHYARRCRTTASADAHHLTHKCPRRLHALKKKLNRSNKTLLLMSDVQTTTPLENLHRCCDALNVPHTSTDNVHVLRARIHAIKPSTLTAARCDKLIVGESADPVLNVVRLVIAFRTDPFHRKKEREKKRPTKKT
jgi:hypothetical protein